MEKVEEGGGSQNLLRLMPHLVRKEARDPQMNGRANWRGQSHCGNVAWGTAFAHIMKNMLGSPRGGVVSQLVLPLLKAWIGSESRTTQSNS